MTEHYGLAKIITIRKDFDDLRTAIRSHDTESIEAAWEKCERWLDMVFGRASKEAKKNEV